MAEDWDAVVADVVQALEDVGFNVTLQKPGAKTGPASAPVIGAPTSFTVRVIQRMRDERNQDGTLTGRMMVTFFMAPTVQPERLDKIVTPDGLSYTVETVKKAAPGGVTLYYRAMCLS